MRAGATGVIDRWARGFGTSAIMVTVGFAVAVAPASAPRADFAAEVLPVGAFTPDVCTGDCFAADELAPSDFTVAVLAVGFVGAAGVRAAGLPVEVGLLPARAGRATLLAGICARPALPPDLPVGAFFAGAAFAAGCLGAGRLAADCLAAGLFATGTFVAATFPAGDFADVAFAVGCLAARCFPAIVFADWLVGVRLDGFAPELAAGLVDPAVPVFGAALPLDPRLFPADAAMAGLWFLKFRMPQ